ncbi:MAG: ABC transporter permease [Bacillota bacterium]
MSFLKRAMLAVTRRKGRTVIMLVIFAAIASMVLTGLAIQHATQYASVLARQKLGGQLTLSFDMQGAFQKARAAESGDQTQTQGQRFRIQAQPITEDMVKTIAAQKNIIGYNEIVNTFALADGFEPVVTEADSTAQQEGDVNPGGGQGRFGMPGQEQGQIPDVTVVGVNTTEVMDTFTNNESKIVDGRHITPGDSGKNVALIEKNLADQNKLKVGDQITVKAARSEETAKLTIIGIYEAGTTDSSSPGGRMMNFPFTDPYNRIYVDYKSAIPLKTVLTDTGALETGGIDSAVFYVDDPQNIDQVKADAKLMKIDWESFTLDANDLAYKQMMGPIDNVASFSKTMVYLVSLAGIVIIALLLMLSVKDRMYETGVLLSMGESKGKVVAQYVAEVLVIAVIAFGLSVFGGRFIAQGVGSALLQREITVQQQQGNTEADQGMRGGFSQRFAGQYGRIFGQRTAENIQPVDNIDIRITTTEVEQMSLAGLIIVILGTILPAATVMMYKPKTILTNAT